MLQILNFLDLAGRMTEKSQRDLVFFHARAVVSDANQLFAAVSNLYCNSCRTGINCIFYQLFHHRGRAFHHLTCCDLVDCILI